MKPIGHILVLWIVLVPGSSFCFQSNYLDNPHWDSGKAEFQVYKAKITKYGIERNALVKLIIVKEPFHKEKQVKTLAMENADDVIKMNYIQIIPTGIYDYHQMASFFFNRKTGRLVKYTMSSQDGCGSTFMVYRYRDEKHQFQFHSYFDDQGDIKAEIEDDAIYFYDALPLILRFRMSENVTHPIKLVGPLIANKKKSLEVHPAEISCHKLKGVVLGGKEHLSLFAVSVTYAGKKDMLYFETDYPNNLIKWEKSNGDTLTLHKTDFLYYWNYTKPEYERLLK